MTETSVTDDEQAGADIVALSRQARFADTTNEEWGQRIQALVTAQPEVRGDVQISAVRQVGTAAGGSNGTLLFTATYAGPDGTVTRDLVLRFLPVNGLFHTYDVAAQFRLQRALEPTDVPVPPQIWLDAAGTLLGRPGYIMGQVKGESTPMAWMTSGILFDATPEARRAMTTEVVQAQARLHDVDWRAAGLAWLEQRGTGTKPIEREVNWYWDALIWCGDETYPAQLESVRKWLIANEPGDFEVVLCHGDANFGNYLFDGTELTAVVDWEMAFLGARECDLTFQTLGDGILHVDTPWPDGALTYDESLAEYERFSGRAPRHLEYFELFSAYRLAVINVLAMKHFPPEALAMLLPILERGPKLCLERAAHL
jgi:aminoglycoside phosphotransferase (APT) family kinase protein